MKKLLTLLALSIIFFSCDKDVKKKKAPEKVIPLNERPIPPNPNIKTTNVVGGTHYLCPQKHPEGNSADKGTCPKCNSVLAHNQGFHVNQNSTTPNNGVITQPASTPTTSGPNANGVFHYTCANGCIGGSGSAGNCTACGSALEHNQAFHS